MYEASVGINAKYHQGKFEKYSSVRHKLGLYNNVSLTAKYAKKSNQSPLRSLILPAIAKVVHRHQILSAIPQDEDLESAYFVQLPSIDLERAVTFVERKWTDNNTDRDIELDELLQQQHNINFKGDDGELPYWRLIILSPPRDVSSFFACFVFHHAIGDGQSGLAFHRSFHEALLAVDMDPMRPDEPQTVAKPPVTPLIPSLEQMHPLPLSFWFILSALWKSIFPGKNEKLWTGRAIDFAFQTRRIHNIVIPADRTSALITASRAHRVSLTATVTSLLALAVFSTLDVEKWDSLKANVPISLRRCLPVDKVDNDTMGTYVTTATADFQRAHVLPLVKERLRSDFVWKAAQDTKGTIDAAVSRGGKNDVVGLLRWAGPLKKFFEGKQGKQPDASFEFSNVGVFRYAKEPSKGEWKIEDVIFGQDGNVVGPVFQLSGATGPNGKLIISFAWLQEQVEQDFIINVIQCFHNAVEELLAAET